MVGRFSLFALLAVAACGIESPDTPTVATAGADGAADGAAADTAMVREVTPSQTADLVREATTASPSIAIQTIDLWIARLDTASVEGGAEIRDDLVTLRNLLQSSPLDGAAIGRTMVDLGDKTAAVDSSDADVAALSAALRAVGRRLAPEPVLPDSVES